MIFSTLSSSLVPISEDSLSFQCLTASSTAAYLFAGHSDVQFESQEVQSVLSSFPFLLTATSELWAGKNDSDPFWKVDSVSEDEGSIRL